MLLVLSQFFYIDFCAYQLSYVKKVRTSKNQVIFSQKITLITRRITI